MADEPRRSHRATKGQHTKNVDEPEEGTTTMPKPKAKGKGKKTKAKAEEEVEVEEEPDAYVRCICGEYEEEEDNPRDMFCCDSCDAWQHGICMGLPFTQDNVPDQYFCEQCRPGDHEELLAAIARGEKPWIEANRKYQQAYAEKKAGKKGGRKSKGGARQSDVKSGTGTPARNSPVAAAATSSQKRKLETQASSSVEPDVKKARPTPSRSSTAGQTENGLASRAAHTTAAPKGGALASELKVADMVSSISELTNKARQGVANALNNRFVAEAGAAQKAGTYQVPQGKTVKEVAARLALETEHGMYHNLCGGSGEPDAAYKEQMRTILFNVKKNTELRDKILVGTLSGHALSVMSAEDMASKELQQKDAEIKKKAEKQHMIIQETGPRIRKTHKGEEVIDEADTGVTETGLSHSSAPARRQESLIDPVAIGGFAGAASPGPMSPSGIQASDDFPASPTSRRDRPHPIDTHASPRPGAGPERKSSSNFKSNFNIQDVWKNVQHSPPQDGSFQPHPPTRQMSGMQHEPLSAVNIQPDADIDNLLKDEEVESPPYSPKDFGAADGIVWHGRLSTTSGMEISSTGRFAAGADISKRIPWSDLAPPELVIDGRIKPETANEYLCNHRWSGSTDLVMISITSPQNNPQSQKTFDKLFEYLTSKDRYGVIPKHPILPDTVKDTYIVPIEAGAERVPDFVHIVANETVSQMTAERQLLVVFVVKVAGAKTNSTQATPLGPPEGTPITGGGNTFAAGSPVQQQTPFAYTQHQQQQGPPMQQSHMSPYDNTPPQPQLATPFSPPPSQPQQAYQQPSVAPLLGEAAAQQVLGVAMAQAPAVQSLLRQVPQAGVPEMNVVKDIIDQNPGAENDLEVLRSALLAMPR